MGGVAPQAGDPDNNPSFGEYFQFNSAEKLEFTISDGANKDYTLSFPEDMSLASGVRSLTNAGVAITNQIASDIVTDNLTFYAVSSSGDETKIAEFSSSAAIYRDSNGNDLSLSPITIVPAPVDDIYTYTSIPNIKVNAAKIIARFTSFQDKKAADGFVVGWNLDAGDYPTKVDRVVKKNECLANPGFCQTVDTLTAADQANYANWYAYHRNKELVVKSALSDILLGEDPVSDSDDLTARMGIAVLNNKATAAGTGVGKIIETLNTPEAREVFLEQVYKIESFSDTPLRTALIHAGEYFDTDNAGGDTSITELFGDGVAAHSTGDPNENNKMPEDTYVTNSPILREANGGYCQRNYAIGFTDGAWNDTEANLPKIVGDLDGDSNASSGGWNYDESFSDNSYGNASVNTANRLSDIALHYFTEDLIPDSDNDQVDSTDPRYDTIGNTSITENPVDHQHMRTSMISFGVSGNLPLSAAPVDFAIDYSEFSGGWPDSRIDDLAHAAWNGRGDYFSASDPGELKVAFEETLNNILQTRVSSSIGALAAGALEQGGFSYRSFYDVDANHGEVRAFEFDENEKAFIYPGANSWSADDVLGNQSTRNIFTLGSSGNGIDFTSGNFTNLDTTQQNNLRNAGTEDVAYGQSVIDFLRGSAAQEITDASPNNPFRSRTGTNGERHLLGPVINSSAVYVDDTPLNYPDDIEGINSYNTFLADTNGKASYKDKPLLFVGANDGMLHALDATSGEEVFAYVPTPKILDNSLHDIAQPNYQTKPYVDGSLISADVYLGGWKTYLVGALRTGGKGIFALDITDRNALNSASNVAKWEFTHPKLGYTFGQPQIVKMNAPIAGGSSWGVVFASGYGVDGDCAAHTAGEGSDVDCGNASLFIVDINDPTKYEIIKTTNTTGVPINVTNGTADDRCSQEAVPANAIAASNCNGLSSPAVVDLDGNYTVDRIYAGDLHGNMWAFDVSDETSSTNWARANNGNPLFSAPSGQSITARPVITSHPSQLSGGNEPNLIVLFGTGQLLDGDDKNDAEVQSFYGVWDDGSVTSIVNVVGRGQLVEQELANTESSGDVFRSVTTNPVDYSSYKGWYIDLIGDAGLSSNFEGYDIEGERVISRAILIRDVVYFITVNPSDSYCSGGGGSYLMGINVLDGSNASFDVLTKYTSTPNQFEAGTRISQMITGIVAAENSEGEVSIVLPGADPGDKVNTEGAGEPPALRGAGRRSWSIIH